jgi:hypothetical protein
MSDLINCHKTSNKEICPLRANSKYLTKHTSGIGRFQVITLFKRTKSTFSPNTALEQFSLSNNVKPEVIIILIIKLIL